MSAAELLDDGLGEIGDVRFAEDRAACEQPVGAEQKSGGVRPAERGQGLPMEVVEPALLFGARTTFRARVSPVMGLPTAPKQPQEGRGSNVSPRATTAV